LGLKYFMETSVRPTVVVTDAAELPAGRLICACTLNIKSVIKQ
jgi:hypothetical protein